MALSAQEAMATKGQEEHPDAHDIELVRRFRCCDGVVVVRRRDLEAV